MSSSDNKESGGREERFDQDFYPAATDHTGGDRISVQRHTLFVEIEFSEESSFRPLGSYHINHSVFQVTTSDITEGVTRFWYGKMHSGPGRSGTVCIGYYSLPDRLSVLQQ